MIASMALDLIKKALVDNTPFYYSITCIARPTQFSIISFIGGTRL